jgi:large subunit ribosomal protein L15
MGFKKRKKRTRCRGSKTQGYGFRKKHKGHGNAGGHGWSGTGKRGGAKQQKARMAAAEAGFPSYFGRRGMTSAPTGKPRTEQINLRDIQANFTGSKIDLKDHKILGEGEGFKAEIIAKSASASAIEKMEKAGGKITLPVQHVQVKKEKTEIVEKPKAEVVKKAPAEKKVVAKVAKEKKEVVEKK